MVIVVQPPGLIVWPHGTETDKKKKKKKKKYYSNGLCTFVMPVVCSPAVSLWLTRLVQCQRFMFFGAHADEGQAAGDLTEDDGGGRVSSHTLDIMGVRPVRSPPMLILEPSVDPAPHGTETENKQKKLFNGLCNFVVPKLAVIGPSPRTKPERSVCVGPTLKRDGVTHLDVAKVAGQGGIVEKKRKREVRRRDATASRENIRTNAKSKGRSSEPSHRVNQTVSQRLLMRGGLARPVSVEVR
ncbi:hypothetical protein EDB84DRAFT_1446622 [Lactarius hengduanensis]|nr:hypothetical protein EDB84DRAFT_1446622 [Lactarius hengduanensis]